jgi:hypothetical protein
MSHALRVPVVTVLLCCLTEGPVLLLAAAVEHGGATTSGTLDDTSAMASIAITFLLQPALLGVGWFALALHHRRQRRLALIVLLPALPALAYTLLVLTALLQGQHDVLFGFALQGFYPTLGATVLLAVAAPTVAAIWRTSASRDSAVAHAVAAAALPVALVAGVFAFGTIVFSFGTIGP